ncbi:MAG: hypothetical protein JWM10_3671 [Myxococcaceae bacterium]|nr:hypothetical protein [Myxococcaceae bacterium]
MAHAHDRLAPPFADIHVDDGVVRVTLLHDPVVEGVDMAIYVDGSGSMTDEYFYRDDLPLGDVHGHAAPPPTRVETAAIDAPAKAPAKKPGLLARMFGWFRDDDHKDEDDDHKGDDHKDDDHDDDHAPVARGRTNRVEPQVRRMLQYLATKDRNGKLRLAYWACGSGGRKVEVVGELSSVDAATLQVPGPKNLGSGTRLAPALQDFIAYIEQQAARGAKTGCGVFVTDGQIADEDEVRELSRKAVARIARGELPPLHLVLVGVGSQVNEAQMEQIADLDLPGAEHLWCHRVAEETHQMAELVSGLVDGTMTVASGGAVYDARNRLVKRYERRLPAVLEFSLPDGDTRFTLEIEGRRYTQELPDDDH